jgi:3-phenylpropionate/trans-cinnamate dioxygenase ferredoxin subunit
VTRYETVCALADLADCQPKAVMVDGRRVAVVRVGGEVFAVADVCSHAEIPLSEGTVDPDGTISCWLHGSRFDLRTGEPDAPPAWEPVDVYTATVTREDGNDMVAVSLLPRTEKQA